MSESLNFYSIDAKGMVFDQNQHPLQEPESIQSFFNFLQIGDAFQITTRLHDQTILVEAYDAPLIAKQIHLSKHSNNLTNAYDLSWNFELSSLILDEWDRFHGLTTSGIPFVMDSKAQDQFFDQLDHFDDDSFSYDNSTYLPEPFWITDSSPNQESYWTQKYQNQEAGWDLGDSAMGLKVLLPKLKLPSSRILVLGGGHGHDAAHFAQQGHHVTLVDISPEAIKRAKTSYGHLAQLHFIEGDIFQLPHTMYNQYDLIFEHTCYCAIDPTRRNELVRQWRRLLHSNGTLLGLFFTMPKRMGPPFGGSEWELNRRLQSHFQPLIWQRFRQSIKPRLGRELLIYMQRKSD